VCLQNVWFRLVGLLIAASVACEGKYCGAKVSLEFTKYRVASCVSHLHKGVLLWVKECLVLMKSFWCIQWV
jgi:hypothetical protein